MPHLPDVDIYYSDQDIVVSEADYEPPEDDALLPLYNANFTMKCVHLLLDKEALQRKMLKVLWLDRHGMVVWWNWMAPSDVQEIGLNRILELAEVNLISREKGVVVPYHG
jgi:hypothetical protein